MNEGCREGGMGTGGGAPGLPDRSLYTIVYTVS
jgi:hypothetical protein